MEIYLVRHAEALERQEGLADEVRHLTQKGRKHAAKQGRRLKKIKVRPELIISSPMVRAVQTAELLAAEIGRKAIVAAHADLQLTADPETVIAMIRETGRLQAVMLVGHEPQLSRVAALLLGYEQVAPLQKGSCLALSWKPEKEDRHARFEWYAACDRKLITSPRKALIRHA